MSSGGSQAASSMGEGLSEVMDAHVEWLRSGGSTGERADLRGADLSGADLRYAVLRYADLSRADLSGADLSGAVLSGAVLSRADLSGADLRDADLRYAVLRYADLSRADLSGADLRDADLRDADLRGAVLSGAVGVVVACPVGGWGRTVVAVDHGPAGVMVQAGCWWGTVADLRARIAPDGDHGWPASDAARWRAEYEAVLVLAEARFAGGAS